MTDDPHPTALPPRPSLVTGASSGLGAAIAIALGGLGWPVALGARRLDKLEEVAKQVEQAGGSPYIHPLDVGDEGSVDAFVRAAEDAHGPADVVVSNAGIGRPAPFHEAKAEDLRAEVDTNLLGPMWVARRVLPGMIERRQGDLVFISSLNAVVPRPLQVGYTATKAAVEAMAGALQRELEGTGVRATVVRPGPAKTPMGWDWDPEILEKILTLWQHHGILRHRNFLDPEAIANAVVTVVTAPRGTHLDLVQVNPEAPVERAAPEIRRD
jgi:NADP-dependent 3-hydroxy acid dehydrogenase YdfG